jgi:hypothetical protein
MEASSNTTARTYTIYTGNEGGGVLMEFFTSTLSTTSGTTFKPVFKITEVEV